MGRLLKYLVYVGCAGRILAKEDLREKWRVADLTAAEKCIPSGLSIPRKRNCLPHAPKVFNVSRLKSNDNDEFYLLHEERKRSRFRFSLAYDIWASSCSTNHSHSFGIPAPSCSLSRPGYIPPQPSRQPVHCAHLPTPSSWPTGLA